MKLSQALTRLKNTKSRLARVTGYVKESATYYEDQPPEYSYREELENRADLQREVEELKEKIQRTNLLTKLPGGETLAGLILKNSTLRSDLAFWTELLELKLVYRAGFADRTRDTVKKVFADGYSKTEIRKTIDALEGEKERLEAVIGRVNAETDLVAD